MQRVLKCRCCRACHELPHAACSQAQRHVRMDGTLSREREKRFTLATSHKEAYAVHGLSMLTLFIHRIRASSDWMHF